MGKVVQGVKFAFEVLWKTPLLLLFWVAGERITMSWKGASRTYKWFKRVK